MGYKPSKEIVTGEDSFCLISWELCSRRCTSLGPPGGQGRAGTRERQVRCPWYKFKEVCILEKPETAGSPALVQGAC